MKRLEKQELISRLSSVFNDYSSFVVIHYKGLTVSDLQSLRKEMAQIGVSFKVVKNSLASIAANDTKNKVLSDLFVGPTAIAWGNEPVSCAKVVIDFSKKNDKLVVVGGAYDGSLLSGSDVKSLAVMPSLQESRSKIAGLLTSVASKFIAVTKAPASNIVGVLNARVEQNK